MPTPPLPDVVRDLLAHPNPCVMTSVRSDGQPVSVATWYLLDGERVLVNLDKSRRRLEHLRHEPRVAFTIFDGDNWYTHVSLQGRVSQIVDDPDTTNVDRIARHYTGEPFGGDGGRVSVWVDIDRYVTWGDPALSAD